MASNIRTNNIDITYPIAGQDNDTQGFRTNFTNIQNNFVSAASEITALQANVATLQSGTISANLNVSGTLTIGSYTTTQRDALTPENGMLIYNSTYNKFQGYANSAWGNIALT